MYMKQLGFDDKEIPFLSTTITNCLDLWHRKYMKAFFNSNDAK